MKAMTRQQLADMYGVNRKTFYRWLKRSEIDLPKGLITPKIQLEIFKEFGSPAQLNDASED